MIVHRTIGVAEPIVPKRNIRKGIQEHLSVLIVSENCLSFVSSARDDQAMIHQVFVNLLSNAIKFTRSKGGGVIEIGCIVKEHQPIRLPGLKPGVCSGDSGQGSG